MRQRGLRQQEAAPEVDLLHQVELLGGQCLRRLCADGARIVDADVDAAETLDGHVDRLVDVVLGADVADHGGGFSARGLDVCRGRVDGTGQPGVGLGGLCEEYDVGALLGGGDGYREPDTSTCS